MVQHLRKSEIKQLILEDVPEVQDLVLLLELSCEDILDRFEDKLEEHYYKFMLPDTSEGLLVDNEEEEDDGPH